ncbi:MAG: hypothetical protein KIT00_04385 [Rhodospirillales bacterium]|nr:hypothetical protein [Rhodospirillales bacterium]
MDTPLNGIPMEMQQAGLAASQALTDAMVERLVTTGSHGLEVLDRLNDEDTRAAVHRAIDGLTTMYTTGSLDAVFEMAEMLQAARAAMTDQMVERLYHFMETMVTSLATQDIAQFARDAELSLYEAADWCNSPRAPKGMWGVLRSLSKPETIQTLNLLVAFGNCLRERTKSFQGRLEPDLTEEEQRNPQP